MIWIDVVLGAKNVCNQIQHEGKTLYTYLSVQNEYPRSMFWLHMKSNLSPSAASSKTRFNREEFQNHGRTPMRG